MNQSFFLGTLLYTTPLLFSINVITEQTDFEILIDLITQADASSFASLYHQYSLSNDDHQELIAYAQLQHQRATQELGIQVSRLQWHDFAKTGVAIYGIFCAIAGIPLFTTLLRFEGDGAPSPALISTWFLLFASCSSYWARNSYCAIRAMLRTKKRTIHLSIILSLLEEQSIT